MFHSPRTASLATQTPQGVGARVVRRFGQWGARWGTALHNAAGRLRPWKPAPRARIARDADGPPAPIPAHTPPQSPATASVPAPRPDMLRWLAGVSFGTRAAAGARSHHKRHDGPLTLEEFPGIAPEALAFFNTPMDESDPELLQCVLEGFAELIEPFLSGRGRAPNAQDVFRALSNRLAAARAKAADAAPATPPVQPEPPPVQPEPPRGQAEQSPGQAEQSPASAGAFRDASGIPFDPRPDASPDPGAAAVIDATNPQETIPEPPDPAWPQDPMGSNDPAMPPDPALPHDAAGQREPASPQAAAAAVAECAADPEIATQDQPYAPPAEPSWPDPFVRLAGAPAAHTPPSADIARRRSRRAPSSGRSGCATPNQALPDRDNTLRSRNKTRFVPRPPRLLCYPACAGPPAIPGAPNRAPSGETCTGPPHGGPAILIPAA